MVQFGRKLAEHQKTSPIPASDFVDYRAMKRALKSGISEAEFQRVYAGEMQKVLDRLSSHPDTLREDPQYVKLNRTALDKISKKFDKQRNSANRADNRQVATSAFSAAFSELLEQGLISRQDGGLIPRDLRDACLAEGSGGASSTGSTAKAVFLAGAAAGAVSRTMTAPLNLVKIRMQSGTAQGMVSCFREVYSQGGVPAFWRGNGANMLKIVPEMVRACPDTPSAVSLADAGSGLVCSLSASACMRA